MNNTPLPPNTVCLEPFRDCPADLQAQIDAIPTLDYNETVCTKEILVRDLPVDR
jgi:hypothetical protein